MGPLSTKVGVDLGGALGGIERNVVGAFGTGGIIPICMRGRGGGVLSNGATLVANNTDKVKFNVTGTFIGTKYGIIVTKEGRVGLGGTYSGLNSSYGCVALSISGMLSVSTGVLRTSGTFKRGNRLSVLIGDTKARNGKRFIGIARRAFSSIVGAGLGNACFVYRGIKGCVVGGGVGKRVLGVDSSSTLGPT